MNQHFLIFFLVKKFKAFLFTSSYQPNKTIYKVKVNMYLIINQIDDLDYLWDLFQTWWFGEFSVSDEYHLLHTLQAYIEAMSFPPNWAIETQEYKSKPIDHSLQVLFSFLGKFNSFSKRTFCHFYSVEVLIRNFSWSCFAKEQNQYFIVISSIHELENSKLYFFFIFSASFNSLVYSFFFCCSSSVTRLCFQYCSHHFQRIYL